MAGFGLFRRLFVVGTYFLPLREAILYLLTSDTPFPHLLFIAIIYKFVIFSYGCGLPAAMLPALFVCLKLCGSILAGFQAGRSIILCSKSIVMIPRNIFILLLLL